MVLMVHSSSRRQSSSVGRCHDGRSLSHMTHCFRDYSTATQTRPRELIFNDGPASDGDTETAAAAEARYVPVGSSTCSWGTPISLPSPGTSEVQLERALLTNEAIGTSYAADLGERIGFRFGCRLQIKTEDRFKRFCNDQNVRNGRRCDGDVKTLRTKFIKPKHFGIVKLGEWRNGSA